ncbi:MAG TPA: tetratricopeptide repeat protein [Amaricoccus sp.]|jgi:tol-pal system protein YbgF|nr:tetratricopeptide repeat protein [Amaricoccus sp.]
MRALLATCLVLCAAAVPAGAQQQNLADVKAELGVLDDQVEQLRDALVRQGPGRGLPSDPATALTRLDQLEAELRRLTDRVDVLTNDVRRIVDDATNRVGDIEFRLTELEGGDTVAVAKPEPLGGGVTGPRPRPAPAGGREAAPGTPLVATEKTDFDAAVAAADSGDNAKAAELFGTFLANYPGGPLSTEAQLRRGEALAAGADWRGAARSYLDAFSGAPQGPLAPRALYRLAIALGELGQVEEACLTLTEVDTRYPGSELAGEVASQRATLRCQ